ncbi:MAG: methyltransferase type 12 [Rugosibacter sp.]|nr:methyltransferase type 12 [Rugosibacter sp.]
MLITKDKSIRKFDDYPLLSALVVQLLGTLAAGSLLMVLFRPPPSDPLSIAALQGACAFLVAWLLKSPGWWLPIHLTFLPLMVLAARLALPPWVWLAGFTLLLLIFWRTNSSRVPLYLTNPRSSNAILHLLPTTPCRIIDLGCGDGALLRYLARARPDCFFVGIEHAPLTWLWAWLSSRRLNNISIRHGDFWAHSLTDYARVYAFLSPAPMPRLWIKAQAEMSPGACLISNSFAIPEIPPHFSTDVPDRRHTRLHVYLPAG